MDDETVFPCNGIPKSLTQLSLPEDHMIYLVQRVAHGRTILRQKSMVYAAYNVKSRNDYCVIVPNKECSVYGDFMQFIDNAPDENIIPIGKALLEAVEK